MLLQPRRRHLRLPCGLAASRPGPFAFLLSYLLTFKRYLILSVIMVSAARMMVTIQKRMVIFDSWITPFGPRQR